MDTSDSEGCFESADEEFYSGDEGDDTVEEVSVKEKDDNVSSKTVKPEKKTIATPISSSPDVDSDLCVMQQCWEPGMNEPYNKEPNPSSKISKPETEYCIPPEVAQCWEPGLNEPSEKKPKPRPEFGKPPPRPICWFPKLIEDKQDESAIKNEQVEDTKTEPLDNPPEFIQCRQEGIGEPSIVQSLLSKVEEKPHSKVKSEFGMPPLIQQCWEPGVNEPYNMKLEPCKPNPEFGIPPMITQCWEPGVNEPYDNQTKSSSKLEGEKINKKVDDIVNKMNQVGLSDKKNNNASESGDNKPELDDESCLLIKQRKDETDNLKLQNKTKVKVSFLNEDDNSKETKCDNRSEDDNKNSADEPSRKGDLWNEDDGWGWKEGEEEIGQSSHDNSNTKQLPQAETAGLNKTKVTDSNKENKQIPQAKMDEEENMWGDDDDWEIDAKSENIKEENLWEGDGWNVDTPTKGPKKATESKEEDLWGDDEDWLENKQTSKGESGKKDITKALDNLTQSNKDSSWGGWGNWGISSVLSTAANITNTVSQGISTVLETGIGVPDPEELARQHKAEEESLPQSEATTESQISSPFGLTNLVSGVSTITKLVESTSTKVISGGLDTLETIGKKTMEVLQENDPGLKRGRAFLKIDQDKPVLSQILREAKAKAEEESKTQTQYVKKANYETIFDDHQGLVHLEALEMLSKQCEIKLESVISKTSQSGLTDLQETLDQVKELCELLDEDEDEGVDIEDIKEKIEAAVEDIKVPISYVKLLDRWGEMESWLSGFVVEKNEEQEIHQYAIETLAELTAIAVEQYHKAGELLLIKEHRSTADEADSLVQLTTVLTSLISGAATKFSEKLNTCASHSGNKDSVNSLITNVFLESANSSRYLQDAFQLLIPVIQVGAV